ncbi:uncharacterized protein BXZ73DRAFT_98196 [Epithele typhae]|uniref:uncharacterized protein n=1 Tax=Epithele typhae TaxID=378194 RepID=UPI002007EC2A|nr:uncharacterized protein BXZ73DRAFT_98196 [Epithele typhae]KAH9941804.1 hypothetical protein BXZ73DRAFT_98196 [Epithele typhae]
MSSHSNMDTTHDGHGLHRYHQQQHAPAPYYLAHAQAGLEPLTTSIPHPTFARAHPQPPQPWMLNVNVPASYGHSHHAHGHQQQQPVASASLPDRPAFFPGAADAQQQQQLVSYPESSQRTHLHDAAAYAALYPFAGYALAGPAPPSPPHGHGHYAGAPADELQNALDSHALARPVPAPTFRQGPLPARRTSFPLPSHHQQHQQHQQQQQQQQQQYANSSALYSPGAGARYAPTPLSSSPPAYTPAFALGGSPGSPFGAAGLDGAQAHTHTHTHTLTSAHRRESFDGAGAGAMEPISPSSVPGLVFDEDGFEDDRESEGSSLPSAASEVQRRDVDWYHAPVAQAQAPHHQLEPHPHPHQAQGSPEPEREQGSPVTPPGEGVGERRGPAKKSKMHQCTVCFKMFPRPSGLATHMNSHSGAKPFKCPIPTCTKSFAVRSNAKRHLRTHGIFPSAEHGSSSPSQFTVGFETPLVSEVHEAGRLPPKLRWVPPSLSTRTNAGVLPRTASPHRSPRTPPSPSSAHSHSRGATGGSGSGSGSVGDGSDSEDEYFAASCPLLPVPLPAVAPAQWGPDPDAYEERNSYAQADASPYISTTHWRSLPGPAIASPPGF